MIMALMPAASCTELHHLPMFNVSLGVIAGNSLFQMRPWLDCFLFNYCNVMKELWTKAPDG